MTRRFHTAGQSRPHVVHGGYRYQSAQHAKLERPAGEPSILRGVCIIALPVIVVSAMIVAFT